MPNMTLVFMTLRVRRESDSREKVCQDWQGMQDNHPAAGFPPTLSSMVATGHMW